MKLLSWCAVIVVVMVLGILSVSALAKPEHIILTPENSISLKGEVNTASVQDVMQKIIKIRSVNESSVIYLVLVSGGGSVIDGLELIRFLKTQENIKTISIFAASMASAIAEGNPGERLVLPDATLMFHRAAGTFEGYINDGEVESRLAYMKHIIDDLEKINYDRIGISKSEYKNKVVTEWWMYGDDILKQNGADRFVTISCSKELMKDEVHKALTLFGEVEYKVSQCPLIR